MRISQHKLAQNTPFETVYYKYKGKRKGPSVMITAGIHGKEVGSILGAQKIAKLLRAHKLKVRKGTLIVIPVANVPAFIRCIRGVPDLNRAFPRRLNGKARTAMAKELFQLAKTNNISWLIDMHEAGGFSKIDPSKLGQSLLTNRKSAALPAVKRVVKSTNNAIKHEAKHFTIKLRETPGTSRFAAARLLGANAVTVETSMRLNLNTRRDYQVNIVKNLINVAGLT